MENLDVARVLTTLADLLEIQGANPFRIRAYRNAVNTVNSLSRPLTRMVEGRAGPHRRRVALLASRREVAGEVVRRLLVIVLVAGDAVAGDRRIDTCRVALDAVEGGVGAAQRIEAPPD